MALIIDAPRVKNCGDCIGYYRCKGWTDEPYSCPIIGEIPDKHGRLVDADIMADNYLKYLMACFPMMNMEKANELISAVKEALKIAPTIVEKTE